LLAFEWLRAGARSSTVSGPSEKNSLVYLFLFTVVYVA